MNLVVCNCTGPDYCAALPWRRPCNRSLLCVQSRNCPNRWASRSLRQSWICQYRYPCSCFKHLFCCRPTNKIAATQRKTVGEYERQIETIYCSTTPQAVTVHCTGTIKWIDKASARTAHTTFSEDTAGILMTKYDSGFVSPVQSTVMSRWILFLSSVFPLDDDMCLSCNHH